MSTVSKFYDPLGILSPVIIKTKLLLQEICLTRTGWDEALSEDLVKKWRTLVEELKTSEDIRVSRHYLAGIQEVKSYRLCGFVDASKGAYAGVVYLLVETNLGFTSS